MLKKQAFANALGAVSALSYLALYVLSMAAPAAFKLMYNAQFMGANVAPSKLSFDVGALVAMGVTGWVVGYVLAWLYNRWS